MGVLDWMIVALTVWLSINVFVGLVLLFMSSPS